jgi:hypothetical protein
MAPTGYGADVSQTILLSAALLVAGGKVLTHYAPIPVVLVTTTMKHTLDRC